MRVGVLTSLFPLPTRPREGVFAERRWSGMAERGHAVRVVQPLPWTPPAPLERLLDPGRRELARAPREERRGPLAVARPRYLHLPGLPARNARAFARAGVAALMRGREAPEVVVCDYAWPAAAAVGALRARGLPVVVHGRGSDVLEVREHPQLAAGLALGLRAAGHWCAVSADLVEALDGLAGLRGRGQLTPNGVDGELFRPGARAAARQRLGLAPAPALVLVCGHLIDRKRPLVALEAFLAGASADARLAFVGRGPLEPHLRAAVREAGAADRVDLVGEQPPEALADWYRAADLLLLTSRREGRPNVVLEALASGLPVVATRAGGTSELLGDFPDHLCPVDDVPALSAAVARVLADPPGPDRCRAAVAPYTWPAALDALEAVLRAAVDRP